MKYFLSTLVCLIFTISTSAQLQETSAKIIDDLPKAPSSIASRSTTPVICGQDTAEYPRYKTSAYVAIGYSDGNSVGQYYGAPQLIKVHGFTFYSWMSDANRSLKVNVVCKLYKAGLDSLPIGLALRTDTLEIDSTFGTGQLTSLEKHATFDSAISLDYPYIIVIENPDTTNCSVVCNSYAAGDGDGENLNCATVTGLWFNGRNLNIGGIAFDADIQMYPHVSYSYKNRYTVNDQCYKLGDSVIFKNQYKKTVVGSKYYNRYLYYGYDRFCFRWYNDITSFSSYSRVEGGAKYNSRNNYDTRLISTLYHYRLGFGRCIDTSEATVFYQPLAPFPLGAKTVCNGDSLGVSIKQYGAETYDWYDGPLDTTASFSGLDYTQNPAINNDTFYISSTNNQCVSGRNYIPFTINPYPTIDQLVNDSICSGANANLEVKTSDGMVEWFTACVGGLPFYSGKVYISGPYTSDTTFYVSVSNGTCILNKREKVSVYVSSNFAPQEPTVSNDTILCLKDVVTIPLQASISTSDSLRWFDAASGGQPIAKTSIYNFTPTERGIYTFYADAWNGVCGSSRIPVKVTINNYPTPTNIMNAEVCKNIDASLSANHSYGNMYWLNDTTSVPINIGKTHNVPNAQFSDTFFLRTEDLGCVSQNYWPVVLTVNSAPLASNIINPAICAQQSTQLKADISEGSMAWYEDSLQSALQTGTEFNTPILFGSKTYYYQTEFKGCKSAFMPISAKVNPKPAAGFTYSITGRKVTFTSISTNQYAYQWDLKDGNTSTQTSFDHTYLADGKYNVMLIVTSIDNCKDTAIIEVNVGRVGVDQINKNSFNISIYPNPTAANNFLTITSSEEMQHLSIVDLNGRLVFNNNQLRLNKFTIKPQLSSGTYLIVIKNKDNFTEVRKLIVE